MFSTRTGLEKRLSEVRELFELIDADAYAHISVRFNAPCRARFLSDSGAYERYGLELTRFAPRPLPH